MLWTATPLLGIYSKKWNHHLGKIPALPYSLQTVKSWKQPKYPPVDEWRKKTWINTHRHWNIIHSWERRKCFHLQQRGRNLRELAKWTKSDKHKSLYLPLTCEISKSQTQKQNRVVTIRVKEVWEELLRWC